jgi:16S rRNA (cytidine1402-2'-O)-methyltransferase
VLVSTPIGNLGDLTPRARETLLAADLILCEDTRHTAGLLAAIGAKVKLQPLHEHNEDAAIPAVLAQLRRGRRIALVSDAGVPLVSDPGYRLVRAALAEGLSVGAVPGANAAVTALVLSGLPPLPFLMLGFPPPRQAARRAAFSRIRGAERAGLAATLIWYEAPHRLAETLAAMRDAFGPDRRAAVCRELTKTYEEVRRGTLDELVAWSQDGVKGEITVVVAGAERVVPSLEEAVAGIRTRVDAGERLKDVAADVASRTGLSKKALYDASLAAR